MELMLIFIALLVVCDIVALHWGFDSRDGINSAEWERRRQRAALHFPVHHF